MARNAELEHFFGDGLHVFRLGIGEWRELQEKTGVGPEALYARIRSGMWMVDDPREILRIALKGGGMKPQEAFRLVEQYATPPKTALLENIPLCQLIVAVGLYGAPDEDDNPKKEEAPTEAQIQRDLFGSAPSTDTEQ
jgi:hypothetical protein